jgi:hypothetical protein
MPDGPVAEEIAVINKFMTTNHISIELELLKRKFSQ